MNEDSYSNIQHFKIPKAWLHTLGALTVTQIISVLIVGISMYIDIKVLQRQFEREAQTSRQAFEQQAEKIEKLEDLINFKLIPYFRDFRDFKDK